MITPGSSLEGKQFEGEKDQPVEAEQPVVQPKVPQKDGMEPREPQTQATPAPEQVVVTPAVEGPVTQEEVPANSVELNEKTAGALLDENPGSFDEFKNMADEVERASE